MAAGLGASPYANAFDRPSRAHAGKTNRTQSPEDLERAGCIFVPVLKYLNDS